MRLLTGAVLIGVLAVGCGSGHNNSASSGPRYADPNAMLAKLTSAGFQCDPQGDRPTYNAAGALSMYCFHGSDEENVLMDVYPTDAAKKMDQRLGGSNGVTSATSYVGANWGVFVQSPATLTDLKRILAG